MIGVVCRDLCYLKLLHPICLELHKLGAKYVIYHWDAPRGEKEYNRASLVNLNKSSPGIVKGARKLRAFTSDKQLLQQMSADKITKMVSVEIWLWAKKYIKWFRKNKIKTYSVLYLTDSLWQDPECITTMDRVYYGTKYLMELHHDFAGVKYSGERDRFLGSTIFDPIDYSENNGKDILVLLPNLRKDHVKSAFGNTDCFVKMIEKISRKGDLIFKTRKKQWLPKEIRPYAKEIVEDGDQMYPPVLSDLLKRCYCTVMFFSSGVYECVYGGNYVCNITMPLKRWGWDQAKLKKYFSTDASSVYQFPGVVESFSQDQVLGDWDFEPRHVDSNKRKEWINKFIGMYPADGAREIARDIIDD